EIYRRYYLPYRTAVEDAVRAAVRRGYRVVHISSHSFAPILDRIVRRADVGLLYDPHRRSEKRLCARWQSAMRPRPRLASPAQLSVQREQQWPHSLSAPEI